MLRMSDREAQAVKGLFNASPTFFAEFISYIERSRDNERSVLETCPSELNDIQKGRAQMHTDLINSLNSLVSKRET